MCARETRSRAYLQRDWERHASMLKDGAATEQQADAARDRLDETAGRFDAARQRLDAARGSERAAEARLRDAPLRDQAVGLERTSPLGIVASVGLLVGTVLTLVVVPAVYAALDEVGRRTPVSRVSLA